MLVAGGILCAQDGKQVPTPNSSVVAVPTSQNPSQSVLCVPGKAQTSVGNPEILSEAHGTDLKPYLEESVLPLLRANWFRLLSTSREKTAGDATIQFSIQKDGSVSAVKLAEGAGHAALGDLAVSAVTHSGPFRALPAEFGETSVELRVPFGYAPATSQFPSGPTGSNLSGTTFTPMCTPDEAAKGGANCLTPPHVTFDPDPEFSPEARKKGTQGVVMLYVLVGEDGSVQHVCAAQPLGDGLDEKAVETIRTWKFDPATLDGKPKATQIAVEVEFHLQSKPESAYDPAKDPSLPATSQAATGNATVRMLPPPASAPAGGASLGLSNASSGGTTSRITPPKVLYAPTLDAPRELKPKYSGTVTLQMQVTPQGQVEQIKVLKGLSPELDKRAIEAVRQWKFAPGTKDGKPVATTIAVEVEFHLD